MGEEKQKIIVVGDQNVVKAVSDSIDKDLYDIESVSDGSVLDLVSMRNHETEQLIDELMRGADERIATNSLSRPMSGQESRRERRKIQRNLWK